MEIIVQCVVAFVLMPFVCPLFCFEIRTIEEKHEHRNCAQSIERREKKRIKLWTKRQARRKTPFVQHNTCHVTSYTPPLTHTYSAVNIKSTKTIRCISHQSTTTNQFDTVFVLIIIEDGWFLLSHGMPFDVWMPIVISESINIKNSLFHVLCACVICVNASTSCKLLAVLLVFFFSLGSFIRPLEIMNFIFFKFEQARKERRLIRFWTTMNTELYTLLQNNTRMLLFNEHAFRLLTNSLRSF